MTKHQLRGIKNHLMIKICRALDLPICQLSDVDRKHVGLVYVDGAIGHCGWTHAKRSLKIDHVLDVLEAIANP